MPMILPSVMVMVDGPLGGSRGVGDQAAGMDDHGIGDAGAAADKQAEGQKQAKSTDRNAAPSRKGYFMVRQPLR